MMDWSLIRVPEIDQFYNFHPLYVHIPVALFPCSLLLYALGIILKRSNLISTSSAFLYLATIGGLFAVISGLMAEDSFPHNQTVHRMIETHLTLQITVFILSIILSVWNFLYNKKNNWSKGTVGFLLLLLVLNLILVQGGHIGTLMVYVHGAGVKCKTSAALNNDHSPPSSVIFKKNNINIKRNNMTAKK
ncbi:MAG: DUF2231 domain-containing protein [Oligoflexia bacterium]|nr:DUF2231 domain-containing protein [Oligoflexia bacterium]